jgi:hypothetical protein
MEKFKVTPVNMSTGAKAPYFIFELPSGNNSNNFSLATNMAKEKSRLSSFQNFYFDTIKI